MDRGIFQKICMSIKRHESKNKNRITVVKSEKISIYQKVHAEKYWNVCSFPKLSVAHSPTKEIIAPIANPLASKQKTRA